LWPIILFGQPSFLDGNQLKTAREGFGMEKKNLKKFVAGLSIAGLLAGAGLGVTGCSTA
jgi:radical SAM modification target selenobiotic family peptide